MVERYPLVEQREYGRPQKRVGLLHKRPARDEDELPRLAAHEVRVFRLGEDYVEDHGLLRCDDSVVVAASSVTVVDRRVGVPVVVEMRIPSAEAGDFTLRTTFHCTVTDARAVVRDGITDVEALLFGYLRGIPGLTEEGADLPIVESGTVRRRIDARLTAYLEMRPPVVSGLNAVPSAVDVLTPEELAAHVREVEEARRALEKDRLREELEQERARAEAEKKRLLEEIRREDALRKELNRQEYERMRTRFEHESGAEGQEHELMMKAQYNGFVRNQLTEDLRVIGSDPVAADFNAYRSGDISADTLAGRVRADASHRSEREGELARLEREYLERRAALEREERERRAALERDDKRHKLERDDRLRELTRQDRREDLAARRQEEARRWDLKRGDTLRERQENREDAHLQRQEQREWADHLLAANRDLKARAIDRGLLDDTGADMGAFINSMGEIPQYGAQALRQGDAQPVQKVSAERLDQRPKDDDVVDGDSGDDSDLDIGPAGLEEHVGH
ncbi:hypothetical protein ABT186_26040 [Streptomyces sp. NPDC001634]|uniref:hypothetical protein n=1 Tax=Streptomyces sp. NPDC001634 TaxID=3154390 RepID=UPI00332FFA02